MNLHFILFYLIKLAFAVNLLDNKSQQKLVRKCPINEDCRGDQIKTVNLLDTLKRAKESNQDQGKLLEKKLNVETNRFNGKTLIEQVDILNKEVLNRSIRYKKSNENDQLTNKFKNQHDKQHSDKHNEQHHQLNSKKNEYEIDNELNSRDANDRNLDKEKFNKISEKVFKSLQSLFEIELPNNPTFNEKFIDLIQALIVELNYIKSKLKQANCKMRLSFKSQRIDSDCETNDREPCNCPKQTDQDTEPDLSQYNYQTISNQQIARANQNLQSNQIPNPLNRNATIKIKTNQTFDKTSGQTDSTNSTKTDTDFQAINASASAINSTTALNSSLQTSATNSTTSKQPTLIQYSAKSKSKKETELTKQLRSAIDCFLCRWKFL